MKRILVVFAAMVMAGCVAMEAGRRPASGAGLSNTNWAQHGNDSGEQRFSKLDQINAGTIGKLGVAWFYQFDTDRGQEATPIMVDGVLYTTTAWSKVYAFDARTGALKWQFDPGVDGQKGLDACCDVVNRGVAVDKERVFVGALDGRLIALDRKTGAKLWDVQTTDTARPYTITGAPRVVKGKVLIGNGGAEYGVRGYLSAYDAKTGKLAWRFYTTPNPERKPDGAASDAALAKYANTTWNGEVWKQTGGGGTVWDSMAYDEKLDLLIFGVGNGTPWNHKIRSDGKGDNLFVSSMVAVKPDTGKYVWHYQETPGESWDYTATQHIILADLKIGGKTRRVAMQAPKNGFFYVVDAKTGALISAEKYVPVNWAERVDMKTGRPVEAAWARYIDKPITQVVGPLGGHNWQPMAFSPKEGLVYIPAMVLPGNYAQPKDFNFVLGAWNTGQGGGIAGPAGELGGAPAIDMRELGGRLIAWDPVAQKARWTARFMEPWNSGLLATAGGLVFSATGPKFNAYSAKDGTKLWSYDAGAGIIAAPSTYELDGVQYVALMVGPGGAGNVAMGGQRRYGRLLVFKLGGNAVVPPHEPPPPPRPALDLTQAEASTGNAARGQDSFTQYCTACHGGGSFLPDVRTSPILLQKEAWKAVVHDGALKDRGMAAFEKFLSEAETENVRAYLLSTLRKPSPRQPRR